MNKHATMLILAVLFAPLASEREARADVTFGAPSTCPPGTRGFSNHATSGCAPDDCSSDASCRRGEVCALYPLCVHRWERSSRFGTTYTAETDGPCTLGMCFGRSTCEIKSRCVPAGLASSGCAAIVSSGLSAVLLIVACAAALLAVRRALARRRSRLR